MCIFWLFEHAIGASDATTSYELQVNPEGQEGSQEVEVQPTGPEEPEEEVECPNHEPASFVKGKPRSILSLPLFSKVHLICSIYWCITYRSCDAANWSPLTSSRFWAGPQDVPLLRSPASSGRWPPSLCTSDRPLALQVISPLPSLQWIFRKSFRGNWISLMGKSSRKKSFNSLVRRCITPTLLLLVLSFS